MGSHCDLGLVRRLRQPPLLCRVCVCLVPPVRDPHTSTFLQKLRVDWPTSSKSTSIETLRTCVLAELNSASEEETLPPGVLGRVCLKELVEQSHAAGYDRSIDHCLGRTKARTGVGAISALKRTSAPLFSVVTEDLLAVLSELQEAVRHWPESGHPGLVSGSSPDLCPNWFSASL